jgi:peptidoglycan/xylan/chitin deacetylase (PgdA/CDA1 family)
MAASAAMTSAWRRLINACALCTLVAWPAAASGSTRVVFTVDVESNDRLRLPDQVDAVCADGTACGLMAIVRLLDARGWSGTFFLNVYEHQRWGEAAMRNIAVQLQGAGQDVALHTHPHWVYDASRRAMYQYSLDEQTAIVRDGVHLLREWTGRPVVAHRAGGYAADERTLTALQRSGVLVDSSMFWTDPDSRLDALGFPRNLPTYHAGVAEIPVSVYQRDDRPAIFEHVLGPVSKVTKIDPNWFVDGAEARNAIRALVEVNVPVLVVFLHSFSFMYAGAGGGPPQADQHAMDMFRVIVDAVALRQLQVLNMRELASALPPMLLSVQDVVPRVDVRIGLSRYVWRRMKGSYVFAFGAGMTFIAVFATPLLVFARRRHLALGRADELTTAASPPAAKGLPAR